MADRCEQPCPEDENILCQQQAGHSFDHYGMGPAGLVAWEGPPMPEKVSSGRSKAKVDRMAERVKPSERVGVPAPTSSSVEPLSPRSGLPEAFKEAFMSALKRVAQTHATFTSDDVHQFLELAGIDAPKRYGVGPMMFTGSTMGWYENTGEKKISSLNRDSYNENRPIVTVWKSLIYKPV